MVTWDLLARLANLCRAGRASGIQGLVGVTLAG
jgi:hypothetical protein